MVHSPERWKQIEALFQESADLPADARGAFLEQRCDGDAELKREVESLLASAEKPIDALQQSVLAAANDMVSKAATPRISLGQRIDHYEILSLLGTGGMGQVYLATDTRLKRKVAIKVLAPALTHDERGLRRFELEARAASALNHPNILTIYEFGAVDGVHFIASEYVQGATLRQKLAEGRLDVNAAVDIAVQIARALCAAHSSGIVHRDMKPENVVVRNDALVKVLDFGIAKLGEGQSVSGIMMAARSSSLSLSLSQSGLIIGSARYMSPEQARGHVVDARSDIFSLGVVLYEMIGGRAPFDGQSVSDVIAEILKGTPPALSSVASQVPAELEKIVDRAMTKECASRYQSIKEMLADLEGFGEELRFQAKLQNVTVGGNGNALRLTPAGRSSDMVLPNRREQTSGSASSWQRAKLVGWALTAAAVIFGVLYAGWAYRKPAGASTAAPTRSLAILPFKNLRQDPALDYLGFSLSDAVITKLGYISALTVRPSSAVDKFRNRSVDPRKAGEELNVDTLLTGSFIKDGDDLRITAQLIDVRPEKILWRDSIDVKYDKLLAVQDRVAQEIVKGLEVHLSAAEAQRLKPETPINPQAYEDYLRGVDLYSLNDFQGSIGVLEKATALQPDYAPAWAHLGRAYSASASFLLGGREQYDKAQAAYEKAIALGPDLTEPRIYMANMLTDTGRVEQAVPLLRTALESSPNNAELHWELGYAYRFAGMLQESVAECEKARQNNPEVKINSSALNGYLYLGEYDKFLQSLPAKDSAYVLFYRGFAEYHLGQFALAAQYFERAYAMDSSLLPARIGKSLSEGMAGRRASALKILRETEDKMEERGVGDAEGMYKVAQAYAILGDKALALHTMHHSIEGGFFCYPYFIKDPLLENIRNEPELQRLLAEARERHEEFKTRFF